MSKAIKQKALLSTYENEFIVLDMAMQKWQRYLLDQSFIVKMYQLTFKFLLEQRICIVAK